MVREVIDFYVFRTLDFSINYPVDFLFGLVVVAALLMSFVYLSSSARVSNNALATVEQLFRSVKEDRPIIVLIAILGASYLVLSFMGKLLIFLVGIVLPIQGLLNEQRVSLQRLLLYLAILLHATLRKRNLANKVANKIDQVGVQATPMGLFLSALGLRNPSLLE